MNVPPARVTRINSAPEIGGVRGEDARVRPPTLADQDFMRHGPIRPVSAVPVRRQGPLSSPRLPVFSSRKAFAMRDLHKARAFSGSVKRGKRECCRVRDSAKMEESEERQRNAEEGECTERERVV